MTGNGLCQTAEAGFDVQAFTTAAIASGRLRRMRMELQLDTCCNENAAGRDEMAGMKGE